MCKLITEVARKMIILELSETFRNLSTRSWWDCQLNKQSCDSVANIQHCLGTSHIWPQWHNLDQFLPLRFTTEIPVTSSESLLDKTTQLILGTTSGAGDQYFARSQGQTNQKWIGYPTRRDWTYWLLSFSHWMNNVFFDQQLLILMTQQPKILLLNS